MTSQNIINAKLGINVLVVLFVLVAKAQHHKVKKDKLEFSKSLLIHKKFKTIHSDSLFRFLEMQCKDTTILMHAGLGIISRIKDREEIDLNFQLNREDINDDYLVNLFSILATTYRHIPPDELLDIFNTTSKFISNNKRFYKKSLVLKQIIIRTNNLISSHLGGYNLIDQSEIQSYCQNLVSIMLDENIDPKIRRLAIKGLHYNNFTQAANAMIQLLTDPLVIDNQLLVRPICIAMGHFKEERAIPLIKPIIENASNENIFATAAIALGNIGGFESLKILVDNENRVEGKYSGVAIRKLKEELINTLKNSNPEVLSYALKASKYFYKEEDIALFKSCMKSLLVNTRDKALIKIAMAAYKYWLVTREEALEITKTVPFDDSYAAEWKYLHNYGKSIGLDVKSSKVPVNISGAFNKGNLSRQEYGDPAYQDNDFGIWGIGFEWTGHAAIYAGIDSVHEQKQIGMAFDGLEIANVQELPWPMMTENDYWGTYNLNNITLSFTDRKNIVSTATDLLAYDIDYPIMGLLWNMWPDCLNYYSNPGIDIDPDEIEMLRCDGVVEYCFESNNIWVWGKNGNHYDISYTDYVSEHNECFVFEWEDPCEQLCPAVQCGGHGVAVATGDCTNLTEDATYDLPNYSASYIQNGAEISVFVSATDVSGIHYIETSESVSPIQPQHPLSDTYTYSFIYTIYEPDTIYIYAMDNGGNYPEYYESIIIPFVPAPNWITLSAISDSLNKISWENVINESSYEIYRSIDAGGTYSLVGATGMDDTTFVDSEINTITQYCYKVKALNSGGSSLFSPHDCVSRVYFVNLKLYLEGPFSGLQMNPYPNVMDFPLAQPFNIIPWSYNGNESVASLPGPDIVDWILIELRDAPGDASSAITSTRITRKAAFILSDGRVVDNDGSSYLDFDVFIENNLFAVIWHRNHLGILSASPLIKIGDVYSYDFTTAANQAYLDGQKEIGGGNFGMYGGDGNANSTIETTDKIDIWEPLAGTTGYIQADYNLDGQVNNSDKNDSWLENQGESSTIPD